MESRLKTRTINYLFSLGFLAAGCMTSPPQQPGWERPAAASPHPSADSKQNPPVEQQSIRLAAAAVQETVSSSQLQSLKELTADALTQEVLARNPTLVQMTAAWNAATARFPQATSLEDPMYAATLAPGSIGSNNVAFGYRLELSQKLPFPGKRQLRGLNALAEASAAGHDVDDTRLQLVEAAKNAFYDYFLVDRALEVNDEGLRLLKEFRENANSRLKANLVPQQDVLQADVEIGRQRERQLSLERMKQVAIARINTLMNLPTGSPLPPPPKEIKLAGGVPEVAQLQAWAVANRPDLQAQADRIAAEQASLALACRERLPDFEVSAAYDAFWQPPQQALSPQIGLKMNVPIRASRRRGAIAEAQARIAQRQAELDHQVAQVNLQVAEAFQQVRESEKIVQLYNESILPAARENVRAALTAYAASKVPGLSAIEAQRNLVSLRDRYFESIADFYRRLATLERAIGGQLTR